MLSSLFDPCKGYFLVVTLTAQKRNNLVGKLTMGINSPKPVFQNTVGADLILSPGNQAISYTTDETVFSYGYAFTSDGFLEFTGQTTVPYTVGSKVSKYINDRVVCVTYNNGSDPIGSYTASLGDYIVPPNGGIINTTFVSSTGTLVIPISSSSTQQYGCIPIATFMGQNYGIVISVQDDPATTISCVGVRNGTGIDYYNMTGRILNGPFNGSFSAYYNDGLYNYYISANNSLNPYMAKWRPTPLASAADYQETLLALSSGENFFLPVGLGRLFIVGNYIYIPMTYDASFNPIYPYLIRVTKDWAQYDIITLVTDDPNISIQIQNFLNGSNAAPSFAYSSFDNRIFFTLGQIPATGYYGTMDIQSNVTQSNRVIPRIDLPNYLFSCTPYYVAR